MSTRSAIGIEMENGRIRWVYCHFDGYPAGVGKVLQDHYWTRKKVETLISKGFISILRGTIGSKHNGKARHNNPEIHDNECLFYIRDCGRDADSNGYRDLPGVDAFVADALAYNCEWAYVFTDDEGWAGANIWMRESQDWQPLDALIKSDTVHA